MMSQICGKDERELRGGEAGTDLEHGHNSDCESHDEREDPQHECKGSWRQVIPLRRGQKESTSGKNEKRTSSAKLSVSRRGLQPHHATQTHPTEK